MTSPTSRLYFIGAGHIAAHHLQAAHELLPDAAIHASDPNADALRAFAALDSRVVTHDSLDAMLASPSSTGDIAIICTPPRFHEQLTLLALASGRNVLCEKPFAMTVQQAERMRTAAQAAGLMLHSCGNRFMDTPGMRHAKRVYQSGEPVQERTRRCRRT
ncbi:Gfo/Idh/MocA family protein [Lysobacter korlensis]|uniref:Gfo/Idh/MocA family protein n=1 Tax=Lysobacter korlensis TaxID=553636 RepID=A0ABV6RSX9_9GAMM